MYQLFIEQMYKVRRKPLNETLTKDEIQEQNKLAEQIIEKLVKAERIDQFRQIAQELAIKG